MNTIKNEKVIGHDNDNNDNCIDNEEGIFMPNNETTTTPTPVLNECNTNVCWCCENEIGVGNNNQIQKPKLDRVSYLKISDLNQGELYELLLSHGIPDHFSRKVSSSKIDILEIPVDSIESMVKHVSTLISYQELNSNNYNRLNLNDYEIRHFFAFVKRYQKHPQISYIKRIADNVYGHVEMHPLLVKVLDTRQMQRLRNIKQLSAVDWVFPSAVHTRFAHSIGTSHLAGKFVNHLKLNQPQLKISLVDELCVRIAGLCHDIGHGPFSHLFEAVLKGLNVEKCSHEMVSLMVIDKMFEENDDLLLEMNSYGLFENEIQFIKDLIYLPWFNDKENSNLSYEEKILKIESLKNRGIDKSFLFEIVANNKNGIDVDKFDYFNRDSFHLGITNGFEYQKFIFNSRVIRVGKHNLNQICVHEKEVENILELYNTSDKLTKRAYKHEVVLAICHMITDALTLADGYFNFSKMFNEENAIEMHQKLDDSIFNQIIKSNDPLLAKSREILERIEKRELYSLIVSDFEDSYVKYNDLKELEEFFKYLGYNKGENKDLLFKTLKYKSGSGTNSPLVDLKFFNRFNPDKILTKSEKLDKILNLKKYEYTQLKIYKCDKSIDNENVVELFKKWRKNFEVIKYKIKVFKL